MLKVRKRTMFKYVPSGKQICQEARIHNQAAQGKRTFGIS
jgi:hypothetical protein